MAYDVALRQDNLEVKCPTNQRLDEALRSMVYLHMDTLKTTATQPLERIDVRSFAFQTFISLCPSSPLEKGLCEYM